MSELIKRITRVAGQDFDSPECRVKNPRITARESIELADYIIALEAERDALAVTVNKFSSIRKEWGGLVTNDMRTLTAFIELSNETPQANLASHDAEVAAKAVLDFANHLVDIGQIRSAYPAEEYAAQLRAKAKP